MLCYYVMVGWRLSVGLFKDNVLLFWLSWRLLPTTCVTLTVSVSVYPCIHCLETVQFELTATSKQPRETVTTILFSVSRGQC